MRSILRAVSLITALVVLIGVAVLWGVLRAVVLQPIEPPPKGERHGPVMLAQAAPLTWEFVTGPSPCAFLTETSDNNGRRVVVDFDCVRAKWPDASMLVTDHGVTVMLDDVMALCGPGISLRCAVR